MLRVTLDSNCYISALVFRKKALDILHLAIDHGAEIAISDEIMAETLRVLREKFHWSEERLEESRALIAGFAKRVEPKQKLEVVKADPDDDKIVACAVEAGSDYLVTGDKALLQIGEYENVKIITPSAFLEILRGPGLQR